MPGQDDDEQRATIGGTAPPSGGAAGRAQVPTVDDSPNARAPRRRQLKLSERYVLGEALGRGGMGEVLAAKDEQVGREVAIKRIVGDPTDRRVARLLREAQLQGRLEHPAIPPVHEIGRDSAGMPYFAMKKLAGTTLSAILDARAPGEGRQRLLRAYVDVCLAVEFAHVRGVIHRDIKPDNIVLGEFGEVYLIDWGVAKVIGDPDLSGEFEVSPIHTQDGTRVGTPAYMAPEQWAGARDVDARADVYSLGRVLSDLLEGDPDAPPELTALRDRACADDRRARVQTARELADTVQRFLDGDRDLAQRKRLAQDHQARAQAAYAAGDRDEDRRTAMREAGRALALDPELASAAALIARLMLEPPRTPPPEVIAAVHEDAIARHRSISRAGFFATFAYLAFVPGLIALGSLAYTLLGAAAFATAMVIAVHGSRRGRFVPPVVYAVSNALPLFVIARLYSPLWIAIAVAPVIAMAIGASPFMRGLRSSLMLWTIMMVTLLGSLVAERLGVLSVTAASRANDELVVHGLAMQPGMPSPILIGVLLLVVITAAAVVFIHVHGAEERKMRLAFHLQAWQVRQLVA
jgi:serine/threonine-protein kinase